MNRAAIRPDPADHHIDRRIAAQATLTIGNDIRIRKNTGEFVQPVVPKTGFRHACQPRKLVIDKYDRPLVSAHIDNHYALAAGVDDRFKRRNGELLHSGAPDFRFKISPPGTAAEVA